MFKLPDSCVFYSSPRRSPVALFTGPHVQSQISPNCRFPGPRTRTVQSPQQAPKWAVRPLRVYNQCTLRVANPQQGAIGAPGRETPRQGNYTYEQLVHQVGRHPGRGATYEQLVHQVGRHPCRGATYELLVHQVGRHPGREATFELSKHQIWGNPGRVATVHMSYQCTRQGDTQIGELHKSYCISAPVRETPRQGSCRYQLLVHQVGRHPDRGATYELANNLPFA